MAEIEVPMKIPLPSAPQLRAIRSWLGISQSEFAHKAGISLSTLTDFEKEHRDIGKPTLYAMAKVIHELKIKFKKGDLILPERPPA